MNSILKPPSFYELFTQTLHCICIKIALIDFGFFINEGIFNLFLCDKKFYKYILRLIHCAT